MVDLNPDGCCCTDETLGVEAEAALALVSQGFSGVDVAILALRLDNLGGVSVCPWGLGTRLKFTNWIFWYRISNYGTIRVCPCEKDGDSNRGCDRNGRRGAGGPRHSARTER